MVPLSMRCLALALAMLLVAPSAVRGQSIAGSLAPLAVPRSAGPVLRPEPLFAGSGGSAADAARSGVVPYGVGGALIGAAIGVAILFAPRQCRTGDSMCGLAIPLYVGAGAAVGGLIGYLVGKTRS